MTSKQKTLVLIVDMISFPLYFGGFIPVVGWFCLAAERKIDDWRDKLLKKWTETP